MKPTLQWIVLVSFVILAWNLVNTKRLVGIHPRCLRPPKEGRCRALFTWFYYNSTTQKCEKFPLRGCPGPRNGFLEKRNCTKLCEVPARKQKTFAQNL
uniref:Putative salivary kunitz domain protein n=1 Tax=Ixodes ricinus TaxID=34613 RepID=A0A0K8R5X7_IXORI